MHRKYCMLTGNNQQVIILKSLSSQTIQASTHWFALSNSVHDFDFLSVVQLPLLSPYHITGTRVAPVKKSPSPASANSATSAAGGGETNRQRHDSGSSSASEPELEYFNTHSKKLVCPSLLYDGV